MHTFFSSLSFLKRTLHRTVLLCGCVVMGASCENNTQIVKKVAVTQIIAHPSLNQEYQGFKEALHKKGWVIGENLVLHYDVAQGSIATAAHIASKFVSLEPDVIVSLSTPSTQTCMAALNNKGFLRNQKDENLCEKHAALVFSAVSDITSLRLSVRDPLPRPFNITGVTDYLSAKSQMAFVKKLLPHIKRLGVVYNAGESNAHFMVQELKKEARAQGIRVNDVTAASSSDVPGAVQKLIGHMDMLLVPNDNTAVSAIEGIVHVCQSARIPVVAMDLGSVEKGVSAAMGYNRKMLGEKIAVYVDRILRGESAAQMPILAQHTIEYFVRKDHQELFDFDPSDLKDVTFYTMPGGIV